LKALLTPEHHDSLKAYKILLKIPVKRAAISLLPVFAKCHFRIRDAYWMALQNLSLPSIQRNQNIIRHSLKHHQQHPEFLLTSLIDPSDSPVHRYVLQESFVLKYFFG